MGGRTREYSNRDVSTPLDMPLELRRKAWPTDREMRVVGTESVTEPMRTNYITYGELYEAEDQDLRNCDIKGTSRDQKLVTKRKTSSIC